LRKIINDPVHGFITIEDELIYQIISHPYFQRLRRIKQMALAYLVYPGAVHTRLHHALGAYHLMNLAIVELKQKGIEITSAEEQAVKIAILLHDIGHGPFSHALEHSLVDVPHEALSLIIMQKLNDEMNQQLSLAILIFKNQYYKKFLYQLISGQLDLDRLDYLARDSFFTGVSEGVVGYDRIIKMLQVHNDELMVEEKGIHSIENFLIARRLMYWQVYLHKTVLSSELMMLNILKRAQWLQQNGIDITTTPSLDYFLQQKINASNFMNNPLCLNHFLKLDDSDIVVAIKIWSDHDDIILADLCNRLIERRLLKVKFIANPSDDETEQAKKKIMIQSKLSETELPYYFMTGSTSNKTYSLGDENIKIIFKSGEVKEISEVENTLISEGLLVPIKKHYICYLAHNKGTIKK
jgi:uncharacterized protein